MTAWLFLTFCGLSMLRAAQTRGAAYVFSSELLEAWRQASLN
jgi:hypothetical protein